ncbi:CopL family metal-binding regulatory protein [Lysobacter terrae]
MSIGSVLLRLLLSLCLVLNGTGAAAASAHMPMQHESAPLGTEATTSASASADAMPCHGGHHEAAAMQSPADPMAMGHASHDKASKPDHSRPGHTPDCCKSGTCRCACVHVAQVGVPAMLLPAAVPAHERSVRTLTLGHAAPALPHPIRPPIG